MTPQDNKMTGNPFSQPLRVTMNDPMFDWTRSRSMRRRLVLALAGLLVAMPLLTAALASIWVLPALLVPFVFLVGSLNASVRGLTELRSRDLDEREVAVRGHAYARLYWPGVLLAVVAGIGFMNPAVLGGGILGVAAAVSMFNLAVGLPVLYLAWSYPDEPEA